MPDRQPTPIGAPRSGLAPRVPLSQIPAQAQVSGHVSSVDPDRVGQDRARGAPNGPSWGRRRVLLLNATFEPLTALPLRRAVVLVVCGKAEVVHGDSAGLILHSSTASVVVPSVIRLSNYVRVPYRGRVPLTRAGLMHRDRYRCAYCGGRAETIDHVVPRSRGVRTAGPTAWPAVPSATTARPTRCSPNWAGGCWSCRPRPGAALAAAGGRGRRRPPMAAIPGRAGGVSRRFAQG